MKKENSIIDEKILDEFEELELDTEEVLIRNTVDNLMKSSM